MDIDADRRGVADAHHRLIAHLANLTDDDVRRPSALPDWTVGHVLTHIARNAEALQRMVDAAGRGVVGEMYPGGAPRRAADIETGSSRTAQELVADIVASAASLDDAMGRLAVWDGTGHMVTRTIAMHEVPLLRWREVEVHGTDLGRGLDWREWPDSYVARDLGYLSAAWIARESRSESAVTGAQSTVGVLPDAVTAQPPVVQLAWLTGRATIEGCPPAGVV